MKKNYLLCVFIISLLISAQSFAETKTLCAFDIAGSSGDVNPMMRDYAAKASSWGVSFKVKAYSSEIEALRDFKSGRCDVVTMLGIAAREFNEFTGSIDSFGAVPDYSHLKSLLRILANPKLTKFMKNNNTEVIGIIPYGSVYLWSKARYSSVEAYIGKSIALLESDEAQANAARIFGLKPMTTTLDNFANLFNYGSADVIVSPKLGFKALDLVKGVGSPSQGGHSQMPVAQLTIQILMNDGAINTPDFGQKSRSYFYRNFNNYLRIVKRNDSTVSQAYEIDFTGNLDSFHEMMRQVRVQLTKRGIYDRTMMRLIKRVRCRKNPTLDECSDKSE